MLLVSLIVVHKPENGQARVRKRAALHLGTRLELGKTGRRAVFPHTGETCGDVEHMNVFWTTERTMFLTFTYLTFVIASLDPFAPSISTLEYCQNGSHDHAATLGASKHARSLESDMLTQNICVLHFPEKGNSRCVHSERGSDTSRSGKELCV